MGLEIVEENSNCSSIKREVVFDVSAHADRSAFARSRVKADLSRGCDGFFGQAVRQTVLNANVAEQTIRAVNYAEHN